mgnify:CR=1 FL=1
MLGEPGLDFGEVGLLGVAEGGVGVAGLLGEGEGAGAVAALGGGGGPEGAGEGEAGLREQAGVDVVGGAEGQGALEVREGVGGLGETEQRLAEAGERVGDVGVVGAEGRLAQGEGYIYASADLTPAYKDEAKVQKVQREMLFIQPDILVVYDRLASPALLSLTPAGAELITAGKAPGQVDLTQEQINDVLVEKGATGRTPWERSRRSRSLSSALPIPRWRHRELSATNWIQARSP